VSLTRPEAALVNNLAAAHLEGFGSLEGVAKAKGEIYTGLPDDGIAILNADNNDWLNWQSIIGSRKTWRFSPNAANSDFTATNIHVTSHGTEFTSIPQRVALMCCCRCRVAITSPMRLRRRRCRRRWARRMKRLKPGWRT
jgi:UDP-N-acetylmuramyl pentapeptide synthase